jgi:hypothetical protein
MKWRVCATFFSQQTLHFGNVHPVNTHPHASGQPWENVMSPSSALVAFGSLLLGAAVVSAAPANPTPANPAAPRSVSDCSGELARQSIARMQRQAQPDGVAGSNCLARLRAVPVETAKAPEQIEFAAAGSNPQR